MLISSNSKLILIFVCHDKVTPLYHCQRLNPQYYLFSRAAHRVACLSRVVPLLDGLMDEINKYFSVIKPKSSNTMKVIVLTLFLFYKQTQTDRWIDR